MSLPSVLDRGYVKDHSARGRRNLKRAKTKHSRRGAKHQIQHALRLLEDEPRFPQRELEIDTPVPRPRTTLQMYIRRNNLLPV